MSLQKPNIVIFDMDGTTVRHLNARMLHVVEWLDDTSFKIAKIVSKITGKKSIYDIVEGESLSPDKPPKLLAHRALHKVRRKSVDQIVEPCPGVIAVLGLLQKQDIPIGLASNGLGKGYGHEILEKFDLERYFKATVFREDIKKSKPNPQSILLALERMDITTTKDDVIWYIGDRHKDVTAALNANKHIEGTIIPIAYALNAALAIIEQGQSSEQIIMSYYDLFGRLKDAIGRKTPQPQIS